MKKLYLFLLTLLPIALTAQTDIHLTNPTAAEILAGNYNPADYAPSNPTSDPDAIICGIQEGVSTDSLHSYLVKLGSFHNRNSGADTLSAVTGIGAARNWAHGLFESFSMANNNRLVVSFLQFDENMCGVGTHKNTLAILPGADVNADGIILLEAHMDSRCEDPCDPDCKAHGIDDNGSGTALVLELARTMSQYRFNHTIVFMLTIGEEQGLLGANAFAQYCVDNSIAIKAVQNNDVVGGVYCGVTSSPPSCPSQGHIDSTQLRIFSLSVPSAPQHRGYARFVQMVYNEKLKEAADVPMEVTIQNYEDRINRGGDHIPFSDRNFTAIRFTSANEDGDAQIVAGYTGHQHSVRDTLGVDTDSDGEIDSFYVDFNYLKRNAVINGLAAAMAGIGPARPEFNVNNGNSGIVLTFTNAASYSKFRVGVRQAGSLPTNFDGVYEFTNSLYAIPNVVAGQQYFISVAGVNPSGVMSFWSDEMDVTPVVDGDSAAVSVISNPVNCATVGVQEVRDEGVIALYGLELLDVFPNPFKGVTNIGVMVHKNRQYEHVYVVVHDISGREVSRMAVSTEKENRIQYLVTAYKNAAAGVLTYSLEVDGKIIQSKKMIKTE